MKKQILVFCCLLLSCNLFSQVASVTITGPSIVCADDSVTYTATEINGGALPSYQWLINGVAVGVDTNVFSTNALSSTDSIGCIMTSNLSGVLNNPDTSNYISVTVAQKDSAFISYISSTYCNTDTNQVPFIGGTQGGIFTVSPSGWCIDSLSGIFYPNGCPANNYVISYITKGACPDTATVAISVVSAANPAFFYSGNLYCIGGFNNIFTYTPPGSTAGIFTANPSGLVFADSLTGEIDIVNSPLGSYTITNTIPASGLCSAVSASQTITIVASASGNPTLQYEGNYFGSFCKSKPVAYPMINGIAGGTFQAAPSGLVIDSVSGDIYPAQSSVGSYTVTYATICGGSCTSSINIIAGLSAYFSYPYPICEGMIPGSFLPDSIPAGQNSFSAAPADTASPGFIVISNLTGGINLWYSKPGTYIITNFNWTASGICAGVTYSDTIVIHDCVWQGDANHDKGVWANDLLSVGLYYSETGIPRVNPTNLWQPEVTLDWGSQIINGSDKKHVDCNGDGTIDFNDTVAIHLNTGFAHVIPPYNPGDTRATDPALYFVTPSNIYYPGDWVTVELWAGSASLSVSNFYGLAFIFDYPIQFIQSGTFSFNFDSINWTGTSGVDALQMSNIETSTNGHGRVLAAISRINHTNTSGYGKIAELTFQIDTGIDSLESLTFFFTDYMANDSIGDTIKFNPVSKSLVITPLTSVVESVNAAIIASVSPNPFTHQTAITFNKELKQATIKIFDVVGKEVKNISFSGRKVIIEREELKSGVYFIQIVDDNQKSIIKKIVIQD